MLHYTYGIYEDVCVERKRGRRVTLQLTSDGANSHQGQEDALGSSTHHFLAWYTSDQPALSYTTHEKNCIVLACLPAKFHLVLITSKLRIKRCSI